MQNILVGFDNSRRAETALKQALVIAEGLHARLHLLRAIEPVGPEDRIDLGGPEDPVAVLDRIDAMTGEDDDAPPPDTDDLAPAARLCEDAGVPCSARSLHGMATHVIREQSVTMDLLVLGRQGTTGRRAVGATATSLVYHPTAPTLLCREDTVPWDRMLIAFEPSPTGGRALRTAGEISSKLNIDLDLLVADPKREKRAGSLEQAGMALRAYHVEGERIQHDGNLAEALRSTALELGSSVVVVPNGNGAILPWSRSDVIRAAVEFPGALTLVVP